MREKKTSRLIGLLPFFLGLFPLSCSEAEETANAGEVSISEAPFLCERPLENCVDIEPGDTLPSPFGATKSVKSSEYATGGDASCRQYVLDLEPPDAPYLQVTLIPDPAVVGKGSCSDFSSQAYLLGRKDESSSWKLLDHRLLKLDGNCSYEVTAPEGKTAINLSVPREEILGGARLIGAAFEGCQSADLSAGYSTGESP